MRKWLNVFFALFMSVICSIKIVLPVYAAELPEVSVPITISLSGKLPDQEEEFTVVLKADDVDAPMPEGTIDGIYTMEITGERTERLPAIFYSRVGVYTYTIDQMDGNNEKYTYDDMVYNLIVTVSNKPDYSGLETAAVLYPDTEGDKLPEVRFNNIYDVEPPSDMPKTGDESTSLFYAILILVSLSVIIALFQTSNRKKSENSLFS